ncbi:MAG TPA: ABC transporter ATP-binding protein [Chloroflexota bacterium]|nr:ABC transporter ATP-binding protein [Chloroflexota bacterium]
MAIVELQNLRKTYHVGDEDVHALDGVSLAVNHGEFMSVMGRSGSGKSTLLNMVGCLDRPTDGAVIIDDTNTTGLSDGKLAEIRSHKIGFVFQLHNLIPTMTALENVMLPLKYAGIGNRKEQALRVLERVGLADRVNHKATELSGGQRQRVAIARALVTEPAIVLADEPTGALDSKLSAQVIDLMRDLNRETGQTFVIVTHDPAVAAQTDRTIHLSDGRVAFEETRDVANGAQPASEDAKLVPA